MGCLVSPAGYRATAPGWRAPVEVGVRVVRQLREVDPSAGLAELSGQPCLPVLGPGSVVVTDKDDLATVRAVECSRQNTDLDVPDYGNPSVLVSFAGLLKDRAGFAVLASGCGGTRLR